MAKRQKAQFGPTGELLTLNPGAAPAASASPAKRSKRAVWIPVVTGLLALGIGGAMGGTGASSEIAELRTAEEALTSDVAELKASEKEAVKQLDTEVAKRSEGDKVLKERDAEVAALKSESETLRARIAELEAQLAEAQKSASQAAEAAAASAAAESAANAPAPFAAAPAAPPAGGGGNVYYKNCAAARAAGAAPVYQGQPGYGRHLDRDGDGIGCE